MKNNISFVSFLPYFRNLKSCDRKKSSQAIKNTKVYFSFNRFTPKCYLVNVACSIITLFPCVRMLWRLSVDLYPYLFFSIKKITFQPREWLWVWVWGGAQNHSQGWKVKDYKDLHDLVINKRYTLPLEST